MSSADAPLVALVNAPGGVAVLAEAPGGDHAEWWASGEVQYRFSRLGGHGEVRWVVWSAARELRETVNAGVGVSRTWDIAEVHRLIHGGWPADPGRSWAATHDLPPGQAPATRERSPGFEADLFDAMDPVRDIVRADGHLHPAAFEQLDRGRAHELARAAMEVARRQRLAIEALDPTGRMLRTAWSESGAAVLCLELERDGLPVDRDEAQRLIALSAGPRPADESEGRRIRAQRDHAVLRHAPGRENADLRNPVQVKEVLAAVGVEVTTTRKWALEPYRSSIPLVDALLRWRRDERIATTYGYRWLDEHVGADDRLRGPWTACDGAAGRMTAGNGLHNLPAPLRPAIAAGAGHVFVRADLGQIEPRVLAVVSADPAFAAATREDDLYAPVARRLGVTREVAKIAVLAAMYGQRSGAAGQAWAGLERAYPVAMGLLEQAARTGMSGGLLRTWGGRLIPLGDATALGEGESSGAPAGLAAARGRYARNAVIQGSAAELFKVWALTVRERVRDLDARVVLCLHDELLVHCPQDRAAQVAHRVDEALTTAARGWARTEAVRFVTDTRVLTRWSEAK